MKKSRYVAELSFAKDGKEFNSYLMRNGGIHNLFLYAVSLGVSAIKTDPYLADVPDRGAMFCLKDEQIQEAMHSLRKKGLYSYRATDWFNIYIVDTKFKHDDEAKRFVNDIDNTATDDGIVCCNFWGKWHPIVDVKSAIENPALKVNHHCFEYI